MSKDVMTLASHLDAIAEQLVIAAEDAEAALDEILEAFDSSAGAMDTLEAALEADSTIDRDVLLETIVSLRRMLRRSVVSLQFQDRLSQRLTLAAAELQHAGHADESSSRNDALTLRSLYSAAQLQRIQHKGGALLPDPGAASNGVDNDDDIELF